jgi:hypothetical protein
MKQLQVLLIVVASAFALGVACVPSPLPPVVVEPLARPVGFLSDVKPVLDRRCVVCHSCYNAACQLKLSSFEGIDRGGSKLPVYSATRLEAQAPTRLFFDARTTAEWLQKGFHSVVRSQAPSPANDSLMLYLLEAKRIVPVPKGEYHAEASDLTCAADPDELSSFLAEHPERGMPFGFPALKPGEHAVLATWLDRGAPGPTPLEQEALVTPSETDQARIDRWEAFLNRADAKHAVTARYLYEHFFLAHIRFPDARSGEFFELVRSRTGPGEPIDVIATVRPYDDPGVAEFYYRFRRIHSTIVHKTHIVVDFDDARLARDRALFIESDWLEEPHRIDYDEKLGANPFVVYAQIPPSVRFRFLLDHSEYLIRTFIRGPVCKGQVALNVIRDHFWVMFLDPDADQTVRHPEFLLEQASNLRLPNEMGSDGEITETFSDEYRERYAAFYRAKVALYEREMPGGFELESIWRGRRSSDAPMLTVYRHFDSASVHRGVLGDLPKTVWVIDYSQFERIYYALVAGFDVFGNISHQVNVRRYMDYLRVEGELNFVQFLPPVVRVPTMRSWYLGAEAFEDSRAEQLLTGIPTGVRYETSNPKRELVELVVREHLLPSTGIAFDLINYQPDGIPPDMPDRFDSQEDVLDGFRALTARGTGFIQHVTNSEANVIYVRIRGYDGDDRFVSIVINRWHDNVNSLFLESRWLDPSKDTIDFLPGQIGSYPNFFLDVAAEDIPEFFDMLDNFDGSPAYVAKFMKFGVYRSDPRFWPLYDWFQARAFEEDPVQAGLFDLNRYYHRAEPR